MRASSVACTHEKAEFKMNETMASAEGDETLVSCIARALVVCTLRNASVINSRTVHRADLSNSLL